MSAAPMSTGVSTGEITPKLGYAATLLIAGLWMVPFLWMLVAAFNPQSVGAGMANCSPITPGVSPSGALCTSKRKTAKRLSCAKAARAVTAVLVSIFPIL